MWKLIEGNISEDYQLKITHSFAALENLQDDSRDISREWKDIRDSKNGKLLGKDNLSSQLHKCICRRVIS